MTQEQERQQHTLMRILKAGLLYFALVFGAGFALGTIRTVWVVPRVGTRTAELMETPIMLAVTIVAAWWTVLRLAVPSVPSSRLGMGCIALVLMLVAEFGFVLWLRGLSIRDCFATCSVGWSQSCTRGAELLEGLDPDLVEQLTQSTRKLGANVQLRTEVNGIEKIGNRLLVRASSNGEQHDFEADLVVHGAGPH